jgi:parallel beta-helix repeat protein
MRRAIPLILDAAMVLWFAVPADVAQGAVLIDEFPVPSPNGPGPITGSSNGYVWFAEPSDDTIGRIDPSGVVTRFPLPTPYLEPRGIAAGPDGAVWFSETGGGQAGSAGIGRIDVSGVITEFPMGADTNPHGITTGPDGNLWFTGSSIYKMTPSGALTAFRVPLHNRPLNIVTGPDGALWFTEDGIVDGGSGAIGRITTAGALTEYVLPTPSGYNSGAGHIAVGSDGNLWFTWTTWEVTETGPAALSVGRITLSGTITEFPISAGHGWPPGGIVSGPDGALWFAQGGAHSIGRISTSGQLNQYSVPTPKGWPSDMTMGPDGNLWFSQAYPSSIGRITLVAPETLIVTSDTTLIEDHVGNIVIDADDVTLDCAGFSVIGSGEGVGILLVGHTGVTIINCVVTGHGHGIVIRGGASSNTVQWSSSNSNTCYGVLLRHADDTSVFESEANANGCVGFIVHGSRGGRFTNNLARGNLANGFDMINSSQIKFRGNRAIANDFMGFNFFGRSHGNHLVGNTARENGTPGFHIENSSGNRLNANWSVGNGEEGFLVVWHANGNTLRSNVANRNGTSGLGATDSSNRNSFKRNRARANEMWGFFVLGSSHNTVRRNAACGNGDWDGYDDGDGTGNVWRGNDFCTSDI